MKISDIKITFLYILFLLLGFNKFILYVPVAVAYLLLINNNWNINKSFLIYSTLNIVAIIFLFLIGFDRMTLEDPIKLFIVFMFILLLSGFLLQNQSKRVQINLLSFYILGLGIETIIIAGYSYLFNHNGIYGYGNIYDPFSQKETNSPITSNNLSILASLLLFYLFNFSKQFLSKILIIFSLLVTITLAIFLGGRTFFIILFLALIYSSLRPITFNKIVIIILLLLIFTIGLNLFNELVSVDFILERFEKVHESKRLLHYQHGIKEFFTHPFGGYTIDQSIENTRWFHNIFLDMGRIAGWIPVSLYLLSLIYILLKSSKKIIFADNYYNFAILMLLVSFLILQQDISIEGDYRSYIILFLSSICLLSPPILLDPHPNKVNTRTT